MNKFLLVIFRNCSYVSSNTISALRFLRRCLSEGEEGSICLYQSLKGRCPCTQLVYEKGYLKKKGNLVKSYEYH